MTVSILGINYASAPLQLRELIAFDPAHLRDSLLSLLSLSNINECLILSTCNRTELLVQHNDTDALEKKLWEWLSASHALDSEQQQALSQTCYFKSGSQAQAHLIEVASGLDSMVLGEPQIFGQMKSAYQTANEMNTARKEIGQLMQFVFHVTKRIRNETRIGEQVVSFASAAVRLGKQIFSDFSSNTAILVGAGETIDLVAQHLNDSSIGRLVIANRSFERAGILAHSHHAYAIALQDLGEHLYDADILITSTASPDHILSRKQFEMALKQRKRKPMFVVDLAVPRDIDPSIKELEDIYYYSIDDLQKIISNNQSGRAEEAEKARAIITQSLEEYNRDLHLRQHSPVIKEFRQKFSAQTQDILERARSQLAVSSDTTTVLDQLNMQLLNRLMHKPTKLLREAIEEGDTDRISEIMELYLPADDNKQ